MKTNYKKGKITVANITAILGTVLLIVFTYIGQSYLSGGEMGLDILKSVCWTLPCIALLWFMIKAKSAENELSKWKIAEFATLGVYVVFALVSIFCSGIMHYFVVESQKEELKQYAQADLNKIGELLDEYKTKETNLIRSAETGLSHAVRPGVYRSSLLNKFLSENDITTSDDEVDMASINAYIEKKNDKLLGGLSYYSKLTAEYATQRTSILKTVNNWNTIDVPNAAKSINELAAKTEELLTKNSKENPLPVIREEYPKFMLETNASNTYHIQNGIESLQFKNSLSNASGFSILAILLAILFHLMLLFNYIVTPRTSVVWNPTDNNNGGHTL